MNPNLRGTGISVRKRGKGFVCHSEAEPDFLTGKRQRLGHASGFATYEDAYHHAVQAKRDYENGVRPVTKITVSDFFAEWMEKTLPYLKLTSGGSFEEIIQTRIIPVLGERMLSELTPAVLTRFYQHLLDHGRRKPDNNQRMYAYWLQHQYEGGGLGPTPLSVSRAAGTSHQSAKAAVLRYRRGRTPARYSPGLARKTVKNVHVVVRLALKDAVGWGYLMANPALEASIPRTRKAPNDQAKNAVWTLEELGRWLDVALQDRFAGMWVLAATTGMRRSELAAVSVKGLDLSKGTLSISDTVVVVKGRSASSDGKTVSGVRTISLDRFTMDALTQHLLRIHGEQEAFGFAYPTHGKLMVNEEGRPLHPDTITNRFNRLVDKAQVRRIRLHDIRHTYSTLALGNGATPKVLSDRVGHADPTVTMSIYGHRSTGLDRDLAETIGALIRAQVGGKK